MSHSVILIPDLNRRGPQTHNGYTEGIARQVTPSGCVILDKQRSDFAGLARREN